MTESTPRVPERVRTIAYFTGLGVAATNALVCGVVAIWFQPVAVEVAATGGVITTVAAGLAAGLGVAYRPTAVSSQN